MSEIQHGRSRSASWSVRSNALLRCSFSGKVMTSPFCARIDTCRRGVTSPDASFSFTSAGRLSAFSRSMPNTANFSYGSISDRFLLCISIDYYLPVIFAEWTAWTHRKNIFNPILNKKCTTQFYHPYCCCWCPLVHRHNSIRLAKRPIPCRFYPLKRYKPLHMSMFAKRI